MNPVTTARRRAKRWCALLLLAAPPAADRLAVGQPASGPVADGVLVMPFENAGGDARFSWMTEGSSLLLAEWLERYGAATIDRDERVGAFERLQLPPAAALSHATVIKVGQLVGAAQVVWGAFESTGSELTVRARLIRLDEGRLLPEVVERGPSADLVGIFDRLARSLRGGPPPATSPASGTLLASAVAFEAYARGLVATSPASQLALLAQAGKAAPLDDRVRIAQWEAHTNAGNHARALEAVAPIAPSSRHWRSARYLQALSQIDLKRYDDAFGTLKALAGEVRAAEVLNAIGVAQIRRGAPGGQSGAPFYFTQATQLDSSDSDYFFNLGYAYWLDKDAAAAVYWLREAVRRDPADGDAHFVLGAALQLTGSSTEAARERELARRLSVTYEQRAQDASAETVPRGLERLKDRLERPSARVESLLTAGGQRDQADLAEFHLEAGRRAFARESDREAQQELRRALYLAPYLAPAHLLLGRVQLRSGSVTEATQSFKIALWSEETAEGLVALAEALMLGGHEEDARVSLRRALEIDPASIAARTLLNKVGSGKPPG
jgi:tetratricopeptide (TPR) repeat protein